MARLLLNNVYNAPGRGPVLIGTVKDGVIAVGMKAKVDKAVVTIKGVTLGQMGASGLMGYSEIMQANPGDLATILVDIDGNVLPAQQRGFFKSIFSGGESEFLKSFIGQGIEFIS